MILAWLALLAIALSTSTAGAVELTWKGSPRPQPFQAWADAARVPTYPGKVRLYTDGSRCGRKIEPRGCALWNPLGIVLIRHGINRRTMLHELGHIFDFVVMGDGKIKNGRLRNPRSLARMTPARRMYARYIDEEGSWARGSHPIRERFADSYRDCALNPRKLVGPPPPGYDAGGVRHRAICNLIRREYLADFPQPQVPDAPR
jgi:hypothetical protein